MFGTNGTTETAARRNKSGNDSYSRLFGPIESRPQSTPVTRMKSNIPLGVTEGGSGTIQNGQQETSTPEGEICSTVCTQTLKAGLLIRAEYMVCHGTTQQTFLWPLMYFNFASLYKE
jgi:hypothetical protein